RRPRTSIAAPSPEPLFEPVTNGRRGSSGDEDGPHRRHEAEDDERDQRQRQQRHPQVLLNDLVLGIAMVGVQVVDGVDHDLLAFRCRARLILHGSIHSLPMMVESWRVRSARLSSPIWRPAMRPSRSMKNDSGGAKTPYAWATSPVTSMAAGQAACMRDMKARAASDRSWNMTPTTARPSARCSAIALLSSGNSSTHEAQ